MPLMLLSVEAAGQFDDRFKGLGLKLLGVYPAIGYDLENAGVKIEAHKYVLAAFLSAFVWAVIFGFFGRVVAMVRGFGSPLDVLLPIILFVAFFLVFLALHLFYPRMLESRVAERTNRELVFAIRDLLIQVSAGIPLYAAMDNVAKSNYSDVSREFNKVVREIGFGTSMVEALENMALRTKSFYLKKTTWQLITSVRAGGDITESLKSMVKVLVDYQRQLVKSFASELNFYILIYLMFAAVLPSVGVTVMIIFSVFGILGISESLFIALAVTSFVAQIAMIGLVYNKRPNVYI